MSIVQCPHCQTRVALSASGECPSCRQLVSSEHLTRSEPAGNRFADGNEVRGRATENALANDNPYAPPKELVDERPAPQSRPVEFNLLRLLFSFEGRIPRRMYWGTYLATVFVFYAAIFALAAMLGEDSPGANVGFFVFYCPMMWVFLAISVKRWHDRGKSGFWVFVTLIPIIGGIWHFIEVGCLRGTVGPNQYGDDPTGDKLSAQYERLRKEAESAWGSADKQKAYIDSQIAAHLDECPWCEELVIRIGDTTCAACNRPV